MEEFICRRGFILKGVIVRQSPRMMALRGNRFISPLVVYVTRLW